MVQQVIFINLFFVPVLSLYMLCYKKQQVNQNIELLLRYCVLVATNIPMTKVFIFLARKIGGISISIDSGYYTLAALISAYLIAKLYAFFKTVSIEVEITKNEEEMIDTD